MVFRDGKFLVFKDIYIIMEGMKLFIYIVCIDLKDDLKF